ncbi:MAG: DUF4407 domain-containing protein [Tannerellaceae bacterium]|jgi:hypothetical protein|nr:DUF4407 domain-containing protein [Tannerellaceae bacterium]
MNTLVKIECGIAGWNPEILKNCKQASYAMLNRYMAAIIILSIIWGVIGWCFADNYLEMESWYSKAITSVIFIVMIVFLERYIILTHGKLVGIKIFRTTLAILMAVLGSTVFDQIVFKNDVSIRMKDVRTAQINAEIPKRTSLIDGEIQRISHIIDSIGSINQGLYDEIIRKPTISVAEISTTTRQVGKDESGAPLTERDRTVTQKHVPNPQIEQAERNEELLKEYRIREKELQNRKLNIATEVREEYEKAGTGFLEELAALYSLLGENWIVRVFYIFLFLFLTSLELLVITTKGNRCDYEMYLEFQLKQKEKEFKQLDNQQP